MESMIEYRETGTKNLEKNAGVFALKKIEKGTLILREKAQLKPKIENPYGIHCLSSWQKERCRPCIEKLLDGFIEMSPMDQVEYMKLRNSFDTEHFEAKLAKLELMCRELFPSTFAPSFESVANIVGIYLTNTWADADDGSLFLKASRFKHSCSPNTITYLDEKTGDLIMKATSKIATGEEITACKDYNDLEMKDFKTRRRFLLEKYGFNCQCNLCAMEFLEGDTLRYKIYADSVEHVNNLQERWFQKVSPPKDYKEAYNFELKEALEMKDFMEETCKSGIASIKEMYKCAKECKANRIFIIKYILRPGFNWALGANSNAVKLGNEVLAGTFKRDAQCFAKAGFQLAEIVYGKHSPEWKDWRKKCRSTE